MSIGLLALLDDIAAIVKVTAASLDDVATQAAAAGSKAAGVVIDDAAVTPKYVVGLDPKRELPIIWNIAKGSMKNKLLFLMPAALVLGAVAPWAIKPILAIGGTYLCFEGYEKIHDLVHTYTHKKEHDKTISDISHMETISPEELEKERTTGAIRTDFILSAEIMAISYAVVKDEILAIQIAALLFVAIGITAGVYGFVALIVKADDFGYFLARKSKNVITQKLGRFIVRAMPSFLKILGSVGTAAMLWVGGGIIIHSTPPLHHAMEHFVHELHLGGFMSWLCEASISLIFGVIIGAFAAIGYQNGKKLLPKKKAA